MSQDLEDINASSRGEMVCPECWERGLVENETRARAYNSSKEKIIHASGCRTEGCKHHHETGTPIPAKVIEMQLGAGRSFDPREIVARASLKTLGVAVGLTLFALAVMVAISGIPFLGGSGGGVASADSNITAGNGSITEIGGGPNWTIYKYGDQYVVAGKDENGDTVYLNSNGEVVQDAYFFDSEQGARDAIVRWEESLFESPETTLDPNARNISGPELESPWSVFKINSTSYVIAAENSNGTVVFLHPDGSVNINPYYYDTQVKAEQVILEWNTDNLPTSEFDETTPEEVENVLDGGTTAPISGGGGGGGGGGSVDSDPIDGNESEGQFNVTEVSGKVTSPSGDAIENAVVTIPDVNEQTTTDSSGAYTISNVPEGTHQFTVVPPKLEKAAAPEIGTITVTDTGDVQFDNAPRSAIYFVDSDGNVANNVIDWGVPEPQQIRASGNGTDIQTDVSFLNNRNANNASVTFKPVATSSKMSAGVAENGQNTFTIDGNLPPSNATLSVDRIPASQFIENTGGVGSGKQAAITNRGDLQTPLNVTVTGGKQTVSKSNSGTSDGLDTTTVGEISGDAPAQNAKLTITGKESVTEEYSDKGFYGSSDTDSYLSGVHTLFEPSEPGTFRFDYSMEVSTYEGHAEAELVHQTWENSGEPLPSTESASVRSGYPDRTYDSVSGSGSITLTEEDLEVDETTGMFDIPYQYDSLSVSVSEGPRYDCSGYSCYQTIDVDITNLRRVETTQGVTVNIGGETRVVGDLDKGESETIDLSGLEPGDKVTVDTFGQVGFEYDIEWDETHYTDGISVQDSSGNAVHTFDNNLGANDERSVQISASDFGAGETLTLGPAQGDFNYEMSYQQTVYPDSGTITINGDEYRYPQDISHDETIDINSLTLGENTIEISTDPVNGITPGLNATLNYVGDAVQTKNPKITISGNGSSETLNLSSDQLKGNRLAEPQTLSLPQSAFATGDNTIRVRAADGSRVIAEFNATGLKYQSEAFTSTNSTETTG